MMSVEAVRSISVTVHDRAPQTFKDWNAAIKKENPVAGNAAPSPPRPHPQRLA